MSKLFIFCIASFLAGSIACTSSVPMEPSNSADSAIVIPIEKFAFNGQDTIWLVTHKSHLMRSEDGGKSWVSVDLKPYGQFRALTFLNNTSGRAVNDKGQVWGTNDGGNTWDLLATLNYDKAPFVGPLVDIRFLDEQQGWILDPFAFWSTSDSGRSWEKHSISVQSVEHKELVYQLVPLSSELLWLRGQKKEIYYSEDGGKIWQKRPIGDSVSDIRQIVFLSSQLGWVCIGHNGGVYKTEDAGKTWQKQNLPLAQPNLYSIHFVNEKEGWTAGTAGNGSSPLSQGVLLHTKDGGNTWEQVVLSEADEYYKAVHFSTAEQGWLISKEKVYRTNDKGITWEKVFDISGK